MISIRPKYYLTEENKSEKVLLVGVQLSAANAGEIADSLDELAQLTRSAGAVVVHSVIQRKSRPDPAFFIGRGKADELKGMIAEMDVNTVVFDEELSPAQQRNLETLLEAKVVDRAELILDIFAQRAHTREGKLQVELAQLHYLLPRLTGKGILMSRLGGGIGTRGPGETKLEVDRRRLRDRIRYLEKAIEEIKQHRTQQRSRRQDSDLSVLALVGYTNAGKSTLLNRLCGADVLVEDKLFATLDPATRRLKLPNGQEIIVTDTVGFIRKLPHQLVAAFRATLEEILQADLLMHIVDISHPNRERQIQSVLSVLKEIGAGDKPVLTVLNKIDQVENRQEYIDRSLNQLSAAIAISAEKSQGLLELEERLMQEFQKKWESCVLYFPLDRADLTAQVHQDGRVLGITYHPDAVELNVQLLHKDLHKYEKYIMKPGQS